MEVKVLFLGVLSEITDTKIKYYREVKSISDLKHRIQDDFPEVVHYDFRIYLNNEIINDEPVLNDGDEVTLMPPFAGN